MKPILDTTAEDLRGPLEVGVFGAATAVHTVLEPMRDAGHGTILFTTGTFITRNPQRAGVGVSFSAEVAYAEMLLPRRWSDAAGMHRTIPPTAAERRRAHLRAGGAAIAAFLVLLLLGASHRAAAADTAVPATTPAGASTPAPSHPAPAEPQPTEPAYPHRDSDHDGDGDGAFRGGGHFDGRDDGGFAGGDTPSAPSTGGSTSGAQT